MTDLAEWESFYVIVGAAAGGLIGLQFVVMTLIAERPPKRAAEAGAAFATPTIVHFSVALLLCALLRVPWQGIMPGAVLCGLIGFSGFVYIVVVQRRMRKQTVYRPQFEDWLFHVVLPMAAYALIALSPLVAVEYTRGALLAIGAASLLLLFAGIHNAWDAVTYHVLVNGRDADVVDDAKEKR